MKIAVVGTGAIGSFYGGKLAHGGRDVHFLLRSGIAKIKRSGIRIRGKKENFHVARVQCYETANAIGPCDLVLIALKATNNEALLQLIPALLHQRTILLTLQNGLGNEDFLAQHFGDDRVMGGLCFICLNRISPGLIEHLDYGHLTIGEFIGSPRSRTRAVAHEFQQSGVVCQVVDKLMEERWRKLVWNIPFNGLTIAAGGITTKDILRDASLHSAALALMNEIIEGAKSCGHNLTGDVAVEHMKRTETMGAYKPSTLLDFEAGRALEVEAIWGEPLRRAQANGAAMPRLEQLYALLKSLNARARMRHRLPPSIEVRNLQRIVRISTRRLQEFANIACALAWKQKQPEAEIASVPAVSVLIVSDRRMAALHKEFCGLAGPTDVLTFQHGELVISAETAARQARIFHSNLMAEIQLYLLHGLLHLAGFDDVTAHQQKRMQRLQNKLLATAIHGL